MRPSRLVSKTDLQEQVKVQYEKGFEMQITEGFIEIHYTEKWI